MVNVIGGAARTPDPEFLIGGSVNAAMHNFTKGLSGLGKRDGVNVNAILPGMTETERVEQLFRQRAEAGGTSVEEVRTSLIAKDGLARLGKPEDVAALALFLCSGARAAHPGNGDRRRRRRHVGTLLTAYGVIARATVRAACR